ncbi:hypothetical protein [Dyadobacter fermentans]|uniref:hypothetical protein n=1 Tax=Dyadobacter fermentans TaxID=94254 RepID=UPI001CBC9C3C|nr:hypothetical protein [Dyadobacter fermentans]MBZ1359764.1 hypothetical protein [Dyadobacter fermentans]
MKEVLLFSITLTGVMPSFGQKASEIIGMEHPAIAVVNNFLVAAISGDPERIASYLTDDFMFYHGTSAAQYDLGIGKSRFVRLVYCHQQASGCLTIEPFPNLYPERVQYLEDYRNQEVWVQTWNVPRGVNRVTGAKLSAPSPRLYKISKGNKIKVIINYTLVHRKQLPDS